jgi:hypothetical protein
MRDLRLPLTIVVLLTLVISASAIPAAAAPELQVTVEPPPITPVVITLNQVRNNVDSWLDQRWETIQQRQDTYFLQNGHYWQGLRSHSFDLSYSTGVNAESPADALNTTPTDQPISWIDLFPEFDIVPIPAVLTVDVYDGPSGQGYVATLVLYFDGVQYERSLNVGAEGWRGQGWHQVQIEAIQQ